MYERTVKSPLQNFTCDLRLATSLTVVAILAFVTLRKSQSQNQPASRIDLLTPSVFV
jgi:hypothetical protein